MDYTSVSSPKWSKDRASIEVLATFPGVGEVDFSAAPDDPEPHGREIYARAVVGDFGPIADFTPTGAEVTDLEARTMQKRQSVINSRNAEIAVTRGTTSQNLLSYESKVHRLMSLVPIILAAPGAYYGFVFNGVALPQDSTGVIAVVNAFAADQASVSAQIEGIIVKYDAIFAGLAACTTVAEVEAFSW